MSVYETHNGQPLTTMPTTKPHLLLRSLCLASLLSGAMFGPSSVSAGPLYRWVDNEGKMHYGDSIPPQYVQKGYHVVSEQGITVYTIKPASEIPLPKEEKEKVAPLSTYERGLLATYIDEKELLQAKAKKLADIDTITQLTHENIQLLENQFHMLTKKAGDYERRNQEVPANLRQDIATTQEKILNLLRTIERYEAQKAEAARRFDKDLAHYRELKQRPDIQR